MLLAACQGVQIRLKNQEVAAEQLSLSIKQTLNDIEGIFPFLVEDRALESTLRTTISAIQHQQWNLYA